MVTAVGVVSAAVLALALAAAVYSRRRRRSGEAIAFNAYKHIAAGVNRRSRGKGR